MKKTLLALLLLPLLLGSCGQASLGGNSSNPNGSADTGEHTKIEVRLEIWFNSHTSRDHKAKDNQSTL